MSARAPYTKSGMSLPALRFCPVSLVPLASLFLFACSGASSSSSDMHGDSGTSMEPEGGSPAPGQDGSTPPDAGSNPDSATHFDAGHPGDAALIEAGTSLLTPSPPAGSTECGSGLITQASAMSVCMMPDAVLDSMPLPDGGTAMTPRACDAITITSGNWQVWCTSKVAYVWARFDGVKNTGTLHDCHGLSLLNIDEGVFSYGSGGGNGAEVATFQLDGTEISGLTTTTAENMVMETTLDNTMDMGSGAADLFVLGSLEDSCTMSLYGPPTVFTGVAVTWK
jgi:hypothetical protein